MYFVYTTFLMSQLFFRLSNLNHELADSFVKRSFEINELAQMEGLITVDNLNYIVESLKNFQYNK